MDLNKLPIDNMTNITPVSGGSVNQAYRVDTSTDTYFLLVQANRDASFYEAEIAGLKELQAAGITAPRVIATGDIDNDAYLILTYLTEGHGSQVELAKTIAKMHRHTSSNDLYGFDYDYVGKDSTFKNDWTDSWIELFVYNRLDVLNEQLNEKDFWRKEDNDCYQIAREKIIAALENRQPEPSLLHGDLWGGNFMFLKDGEPALFDPHPLYGDREFDIGITTVFGSYKDDFYKTYQNLYPLDEGFDYRLEFYRLYLMMVHAVKFGLAYYNGTKLILEKIGGGHGG